MKFGKSFLIAVVLMVIVAALLCFVRIVHEARTNLTPQEAWAALTNFSMPTPPMTWETNPPTGAELAKFDDLQAGQAVVLADRARDFYTRFPGDANVLPARVAEVQALMAAVHFGATNRAEGLVAREGALITDTNVPEDLRYQLRIDQLGRVVQKAVAAGADTLVEMEKAGRALVKEFPNGQEGYNILLTVAGNGDLLKMHDLAQLMANSGGPADLTDIGKCMLRQLDVVGKPLPVDFTTADDARVNATTLSNRVVLVDFWATWCPICVEAMPEVKRLYEQYHKNGFEVIGVNFDDDAGTGQRFVQGRGLAWPQYYGGYGASNKYGREYGSVLPYVWLVDKQGIVRDIHGRKDTEAKIQKLLAE